MQVVALVSLPVSRSAKISACRWNLPLINPAPAGQKGMAGMSQSSCDALDNIITSTVQTNTISIRRRIPIAADHLPSICFFHPRKTALPITHTYCWSLDTPRPLAPPVLQIVCCNSSRFFLLLTPTVPLNHPCWIGPTLVQVNIGNQQIRILRVLLTNSNLNGGSYSLITAIVVGADGSAIFSTD